MRVVAPISVKRSSESRTDRAPRLSQPPGRAQNFPWRGRGPLLWLYSMRVDLVHKQHVARFEVGGDGGQISQRA